MSAGLLQTLDTLTNLAQKSQQLAGSYFPRITWTGEVAATGFADTPTRTVLHYCLAVAFGLMRQSRLGSVALTVRIEYRTNTVHVVYVSQTSLLTEAMSLAILTGQGKTVSPQDLLNIAKLGAELTPELDFRSILPNVSSFNPLSGIAKIVDTVDVLGRINGKIDVLQNALTSALRVYANVGRNLGPLAVWDMTVANQVDRNPNEPNNPQFTDETIYGGLPSMFLTPPANPDKPGGFEAGRLPSPFSLMVQQPLLTRNPAPNPQPPAPSVFGANPADAASGYSLDLRSLVAQALMDPGVVPPKPDTNVSLTPQYELNNGG